MTHIAGLLDPAELLCIGPNRRTAIEFKYFTARWAGIDPLTSEKFALREQASSDLARRNFIFDVARLERFCRDDTTNQTNAIAIMLTNFPGMWNHHGRTRTTRDAEFRIHEGRTITGALRWGIEGSYYEPSGRLLVGSYTTTWNDFGVLDTGRNGTLRWLGFSVDLRHS